MEVIAPHFSHNTKKASKIAKNGCKRVQAMKGEVLTTPECWKTTRRNQDTASNKKRKIIKGMSKDLGSCDER